MNLSRCSKGHFYDKEKYATCPHCDAGAGAPGGAEEGITMAFTEDLMSGDDLTPTQPLSEVTMPIEQQPAPSTPQPEVSATQPTQPSPAVQAFGAAATIPSPPPLMQVPPVPPAGESAAAQEEEDDNVTVGFFDKMFDVSDKKETKKEVGDVPAAGSKKPARKMSVSPCVGWLIAIGGNHVGEDFRLRAGKNFIGRDSSMDIALTNDKSVSRNRHAVVTYEPKHQMYLVQPGESSELAYLNNEVVLTPVKLQAYDMITVGEVNLLFMPLCGDKFDWTELPDETE